MSQLLPSQEREREERRKRRSMLKMWQFVDIAKHATGVQIGSKSGVVVESYLLELVLDEIVEGWFLFSTLWNKKFGDILPIFHSILSTSICNGCLD
ncbi:hypothetical protein CMV_000438 [Castanea mollissima]|uniref:Uncharacterized protein n=1 Tax=Castanea mollissima TaxID=60419 RepID=A0A8J4S5I0_9ROSI|nr:hypothetical protein CMV_000438 [Castanea mollissima]